MRRAKDNRRIPRRYYYPERTQCRRCRHGLKRAYPVWRKYIVCLSGRYLVISVGYWCRHPTCPYAKQKRRFASQEAEALTVRGSSFALEVLGQIGYWRFWQRWTVTQIHEVLTQERYLPISERAGLYLIGVFLVLLRCTSHGRLEAHAPYFRRQGLFLSLAALQPEKGNTALDVARELKFGLGLQVMLLLSADHRTVERRVLQPVTALGYRLRGVVSEDEQALHLAVAQAFPGVRHQTCQWQCLREAATLSVEADQAGKKALKQAMRAPFYAVCRALNQLAPADPCSVVLSTYAELIRSTLPEGSKPPFALGGLRVFADLACLAAALKRNRKQGTLPCWSSCWPWCNTAGRLRRSSAASNPTVTGWSSWSGGLTPPKTLRRTQPGAVSNDRSRISWPNWKRTLGTTPTRPRWSRLSAPPSRNGGPASSPATDGPNATVPTTLWKPSLAACARVSANFMAASQCTSLSCAMASGPSSLTPPRLSRKGCAAFNSLTKPSLIRSMPGFSKHNSGSKCYIVFAITPAVASNTWSNNGVRLFAANPVRSHRVEFCGC